MKSRRHDLANPAAGIALCAQHRPTTKTYPTTSARLYTQAMSPEPANAASYNDLTLDRVIGFFLARLFAYLIRLDASGYIFAAPDMVHKVAAAEGLVHAFIRMRAAEQLENAGLTDAAKAMRNPVWMRNKPVPLIDQTAMTPVPTAELIERLKNVMADFEQADALAAMLARIILLAMTCAFPETRERPAHARPEAHPGNKPCTVSLGTPMITPVGQGPPTPCHPAHGAAKCLRSFPRTREPRRDIAPDPCIRRDER